MATGRAWIWLLLLGIEAALAGALLWRPILNAPLAATAIQHQGGYQYSVEVPLSAPAGYQLLADSNDHPAQSTLVLLQDEAPIGRPHSVHDQIRTEGNGGYSHWGGVLYFSTPGNTDPRNDAHRYRVRAQAVLAPPVRSALLAALVVIALPLMVLAAIAITSAGRSIERHPSLLRAGLIVGLVALEATLLVVLQRKPTVEWAIPHDRITHQAGHAYAAALGGIAPRGYLLTSDTNERPQQSTLVVLRDGQPLGPAHTVHELIIKNGGGGFSHWQDAVLFSTPGNTDPRADGHTYTVRAQALLVPRVRFAMLAGAIVVALPLLYFSLAWLRPRAGGLVVPLKLAALGLVCVAAPWAWIPSASREVELVANAGRWPFLALYVTIVAAALAGLIVLPFLRDWRIRVPFGILLLLGFATDQFALALSRHHMTLDLMQTVWRERAMATTVLTAYGTAIVPNVLLFAILAVPFLLSPPHRWSLRARFTIVPLAALVAVAAVIFATRGRTEAFPSAFAVPAQFAVAQVLSDSDPSVARDPVEYARPLSPLFRKIVMVVDESVRGDYLGLNNPRYDNTPTLSNAGAELVNYGVAISAANCSVASRLIMRVGLQREQLPDTREIWRRLPTIWQYAKKAGYQTVLVDAWRAVGEFHSYMDAQEARQIDIVSSVVAGPDYARDFMIADLVTELLTRDEPMLIYVNKNGTHQNYAHQFPAELEYDPTPLVAALPLDDRRRETVKNYHKALRSSVDGFFARLLPALQRDDTILIYTSDHGQSLFEGGYDLSHCSLTTNLHLGEVLVPMFVITHSPDVQARFRREAERAFNRASHFEVMPTLLHLMGYADSWVEPMYGPDLLNVPTERRRGFLMGTLFHPAAVWIDAE
jgi:lipid A ethanolaminephosphotransferase